MPGSSLWLLPPATSTLTKTLQTLISSSIPSLFPTTSPPPPDFIPHITLTSHITPTPSDPQAWLDKLSLPDLEAVVILHPVVGEIYFQKLTLACAKSKGLTALAKACREQAVGDDADAFAEGYYPHLSLMYSSLPPSEVTAKLSSIAETIHSAQAAASLSSPSSDCRSGKGGRIVLVPTDKDVSDWTPIASREMPELEWVWAT